MDINFVYFIGENVLKLDHVCDSNRLSGSKFIDMCMLIYMLGDCVYTL